MLRTSSSRPLLRIGPLPVLAALVALSAAGARGAGNVDVVLRTDPVDVVLDGDGSVDDDDALEPLVAAARDARIVQIVGDPPEHQEAVYRARNRLIRALRRAGFDTLVLPAGAFETALVERALREGRSVEAAAEPLYRVWRESPAFQQLLREVSEDPKLRLAGALCRFHAVGKERYAPALLDFFEEADVDLGGDRPQVQRLLGGRARLSRASRDLRDEAAALVARLASALDRAEDRLVAHHGLEEVAWQRHLLDNLELFVELEQLRGGDRVNAAELERAERALNLDFLLEPTGDAARPRLIYLEGRGESPELPTGEEVLRVEVEVLEERGG